MVGVGCGGLRYFWPGVPLGGDGGAWPFFAALGCAEIWRAADLAQPLEHYATPAWVWERVSGQGLSISPALPAEREAALAMVAAELPDWLEFYAGAFDGDRAEEVILARDAGGAVLGACLLDCPTTRWAGCFDGPAAAPGCVLTAASARGRGIGLAVTARASEIARQRGCSVGFIGFTHLAAWYQKLGYKLWEEYAMSGWEYS
jgi:GNAT superfamily N-acetyltransferase